MDYSEKVIELKAAGYEQGGPYRDWYAPYLGGSFDDIDEALIDKRRKEHIRNNELENKLWYAIEQAVKNHTTYKDESGVVEITLNDYARFIALLDEAGRLDERVNKTRGDAPN